MEVPDLRLLVVLDRLLDRASVSAAARDLGVGQPAVSRSLAQLRERFGDPLLVRAGRAMRLTARAEALRLDVRELVARAQQVMGDEVRLDLDVAVTVSLAVGDDVAAWLLPPLLTRLREEAPRVTLHVHRMDRDALVPLAAGHLDLAILPDLAAIPTAQRLYLDHLVIERLEPIRFVVARRAAGPVDLDLWCTLPHVMVAPLGETRLGIVDRLLAQHERSRHVLVTVPTFEQACRLVYATDAVALLPERVVRASPFPLHSHLPPLQVPDLPLECAWTPHLTTSPRHKWFRRLLLGVCRGQQDQV